MGEAHAVEDDVQPPPGGRRRQATGLRKLRIDLEFVLRGERRNVVVLCVFAVLAAVGETGLLTAIVQAVSAMSARRTHLDIELGAVSLQPSVLLVLLVALALAAVRAVASAAVAVLGPRIVARGRGRQRSAMLEAFLSADWTTQSADKAGHFMQNFSASVNEASAPPLLMTQAVPSFITAVVLIVTAFVLDPVVTAAAIAVGVVVVVALRPISRRASRAALDDSRERETTAAQVSGMLAAGSEILTLGAQQSSMAIANERIARTERFFARAQIDTRLVTATAQSAIFIVAALALLGLNRLGLNVDYAVVGTIAILLLRTAGLAQQVQAATNMYRALHPFIEHVRHLTAGYEARRRQFGREPFPHSFDIALRGVAYRYPSSSTPALRNCSAEIPQGSFVGILGPSGSGKSTLIQILLRLRSPSRGSVSVGGISMASIDEDEFTTNVAYVPQAPHLVPGTILDNITFFRPSVSRADAIAAAKLSHVHDEIASMPEGYDTPLEAHVDQLSGGQKQRLSFARALAGRPRVLVLDEPTSALDARNERLVVNQLSELGPQCTVVMITHKPSSVQACDLVLQVSDGVSTTLPSHGPAGPTDRVVAPAPSH